MNKKLFRWAALLVTVGAISAGTVYWYGFLRKEKPVSRMNTDFTITADSLFSAFSRDEAAANSKFGGKILLVSSSVISVDKDARGNVSVTLVDPFAGVTCTIDSLEATVQYAEIQALTEGAPVQIKGRCDGMLSDVKLSKCMIVK